MNEIWTIPALKEYIDARFNEVQQAVAKADAANEKRLDNVNEFRATLETQQSTFVTKEQVRWAFGSLVTGAGVVTAIYMAVTGGTS